ncbi:MAG: T9SS type A sorting domain-containing protein [Chitinophagales bacterium]|nr:T9SS type A sorting domain-containing protein [Chitinophagales bacterium]
MKKVIYAFLLMLWMGSIAAQNPDYQIIHVDQIQQKDFATKDNEETTTRSSGGCTDFFYYQGIDLGNFVAAWGSIVTTADGTTNAVSGADDFVLTSNATIGTVIITVHDYTSCNPNAYEISFREDDNGSPGSVIDTRSVPAGVTIFTHEGINETWRCSQFDLVNAHIPITPIDLGPGTYWLELTAVSPTNSEFDATSWCFVTPTGANAVGITDYYGEQPLLYNSDLAFALCGPGSMPASPCGPAPLEAICQNTTIALPQGGQATITASDVDGCSIGATSSSVSPSTLNCSNIGANTVTLTVMDDSGNSAYCTATVTITDGGELPSSWQGADIGGSTTGNDYSFSPCSDMGDQFIVTGSGNNATSVMTDNIAFASQTLCGDGSITAKIESVAATGYGGLMIRETTAAGSKQVSIFSNMSNLLRHESRTMMNGPKTVQSFFKPSPTWLRMRRVGNWVHVEYSSNGMTYLPVQSTFVMMSSCVEIGLASFTYLPFGETDAVFSNVTTTGNIQEGSAATTAETDVSPLAIQTFVKENDLQLYPNPTRANFTLQLEIPLEQTSLVEVINLYGQSIAQQQLMAGQIQQEWNTVDWPAGTYMLKITREGQLPLIKQFVVMK